MQSTEISSPYPKLIGYIVLSYIICVVLEIPDMHLLRIVAGVYGFLGAVYFAYIIKDYSGKKGGCLFIIGWIVLLGTCSSNFPGCESDPIWRWGDFAFKTWMEWSFWGTVAGYFIPLD